jgi:hypothetical protein
MNYRTVKHHNDDDDVYAFQANIVDLTLPDPPMNDQVIFVNIAHNDTNDDNNLTLEKAKNSIVKVPARFNYVVPSTTTMQLLRDTNGDDYKHENDTENDTNTNGMGWFTNHQTIWVENGRLQKEKLYTLHTNGFELISNTTSSSRLTFPEVPRNINFMDHNHVIDHYYPYCQELLQQYLGASNVTVYAFDHNVRKQQADIPNNTDKDDTITTTTSTTTVPTKNIQKPVGIVHGDYTTISGPRRLQLLSELPKVNDILYHRLMNNEKQQTVLDPNIVTECFNGQRRYALINIWRNIDETYPVVGLPLACVDAVTHTIDDLRTLEIHYTDRVGENYLVCHPQPQQVEEEGDSSSNNSNTTNNRQHRWVYFPFMDYSEALLLKQWDSVGDMAKEASSTTTNKTNNDNDASQHQPISTFTIHSAFIDPITNILNQNNIPTPPRQSIEVRCVAIWDTPM